MTYPATPDPVSAAFSGRCPRCGTGELFSGYLAVHARCSECDLDLAFADSGDGPAFFVMSIVGFVAVAFVITLIAVFDVVAGLALLLGMIVTLGLTFALLKPAKGLLIGLQYKNDASEGRLQ